MADLFDNEVPQDGAEWMRAMVRQLELTEKATVAQQEAFQQRALLALLQHAYEHVPAYKDRLKPLLRLDGSLDLAGWHDVPVLHRDEAVELGDDLEAGFVPEDHLPVTSGQTSGSTAAPFHYKNTQFNRTMSACISARFLRWHGFDYSKKLASIRPFDVGQAVWPNGKMEQAWAATSLYNLRTGKHFLLNINTPVEQQVAWLRKVRPAYLVSFASNLRAIATVIQNDGGAPLKLERIVSYGEMLTNDMREVISTGFGTSPIDCYSTRECGFLTGQSPASENHLVQSEVCVVEVLDEDNKPCEIGQTGLVVITLLHNYAQPFVRYATGDYAVMGRSDYSGLPFPVLSKILGRTRNVFRFAGGKLIQPDFKSVNFNKYLGPKHWQVAQIGLDRLEVRIVQVADPTKMDTDGMSAHICQILGMDLKISFKQVSELKNPRTGKHEDYVCELD